MSERDGSSGAEGRPLRYGTIVVVGGGCYGSYYVRQLERAARAGAISFARVAVVDRNPACIVSTRLEASATKGAKGVELVVSEWRDFFRQYLDSAAADRERASADAIVPSPLMPHLMFEWILDRARRRWPEREVATKPLASAPPTPWQRATENGPHYVSYAEWICPINCIEPRICPHTRGPRTWTLPRTAEEYVASEHRQGRPLVGPVIFHCTHRAYGVGMFDTHEVIAGDDLVRTAAQDRGAELLVGTMSHCHGAFERLVVGPPVSHGFAGSRH